MESDESLAALRKDPRFKNLLERARANRAKVPARQFDFWVGAWDVYDARNLRIGTTDVVLRRNGHLLHATWTDAKSGTDSESFTFYDPGRGRWRQMSVDDGGAVMEYLGGYYDGGMRLMGRETVASGTSVLSRSTYSEIEGGKLRHVLERSADGGVTWTLTFERTYVRRSS